MKVVYSDKFPADVDFFTPGKRYEIFDKMNTSPHHNRYQAFVIGDDGKKYGPLNINWPCAYLDGEIWSIEDDKAAS